jgi:hypothetical protein
MLYNLLVSTTQKQPNKLKKKIYHSIAMAPSTGQTTNSRSSHKRKRLKKEDVVFNPSPMIPVVSQTQVALSPQMVSSPLVTTIHSNATQTQTETVALDVPTQPSDNSHVNNPPVPTALAGQFDVHAPPTLLVRDELFCGRFIQFGFE